MEINAEAKALSAAAKRINDLQQQTTEKMLKIAVEVEKLLGIATAREAKAFLKVHCGFSSSDLGTYVKFSKTLKGSEDTLAKNRVPFSVVKSLVATDHETRAKALTAIASGAHLDPRGVAAIRRRHRTEKMSGAQIFEKERSRTIKAELRRRATSSAEALDQAQGAFLDLVRGFECRYRGVIGSYSEPNANAPDTSLEYETAFEQIRSGAEPLLGRFCDIFGATQDPDEDLMTTRARLALREFTAGQFAHKGGWTCEDGQSDAAQIDMISALIGLTSKAGHSDHVKTVEERQTNLVAPSRALASLELCAGLGGMSLGLEAAGFDPVALIENGIDAAASLRANRPDWNVVEQDLKAIDYSPYRGRIALLSGGLPCQPYSRAGKALGKNDERDLFPAAANIVDAVRPAAFMFENVVGFLDAKHADHRAAIFARFAAAGYAVRIITVNAEDYGIAQERSRIFIIGMSPQDMIRFRPPPTFDVWRVTLGDALEDLMAAGKWSGAAAWCERRRKQIIVRNGKVQIGALVSTLLGEKRIPRKKERERWGRRELSAGKTADGPPTDAMAAAAGDGFKPGLTLPMKLRLMSLPDDYIVTGNIESQSQQIANAVCPRVAQAVGMSIYAALLDTEFDWEVALKTPRLPYENTGGARIKVEALSLPLDPAFFGTDQRLQVAA